MWLCCDNDTNKQMSVTNKQDTHRAKRQEPKQQLEGSLPCKLCETLGLVLSIYTAVYGASYFK